MSDYASASVFVTAVVIALVIFLSLLTNRVNKRTALTDMSDFSGRSLLILAMFIRSVAVGLECGIREFFRALILDFKLRYRFISSIHGIEHKPSIIVFFADIACFFLVVIACSIMATTVGFQLALQKFLEVSNRAFSTLIVQLNVPMKSLIR